jgi:hypothetical protein
MLDASTDFKAGFTFSGFALRVVHFEVIKMEVVGIEFSWLFCVSCWYGIQ